MVVNPNTDRRSRLAAVVVTAVLTLTATAACTDEANAPHAGRTTLPQHSVGTQPTLVPQPVPMDVKVARVVNGRLRPVKVARVERQVGAAVAAYLEDAFLGDYPRRDFSSALEGFSPGSRRLARADLALVTNAAHGQDTQAVTARAHRIRLDVLMARGFVAGLTARIRLVFVEQRTSGADRRVAVTGRLLLNRNRRGAWQIFGYELSRSATPAAGEARR